MLFLALVEDGCFDSLQMSEPPRESGRPYALNSTARLIQPGELRVVLVLLNALVEGNLNPLAKLRHGDLRLRDAERLGDLHEIGFPLR